jgi:hypothetical protein
MKQKWLYTVVLLMVCTIGLHAQEHVEKVDTTVIKPQPLISTPAFAPMGLPFFPVITFEQPESKEEQAVRINRETYQRVMTSVNQYLSPYRPAHLTEAQKTLLFIGGLFLNSPYKFRPGTVPLMNASNPFVYAVTPGMAPFEHPYSPDKIPQCIRTELDFSSGTYKQVMIKWSEVEKSMVRSYGGPYRLEPVPRMRFNNYGDHLVP